MMVTWGINLGYLSINDKPKRLTLNGLLGFRGYRPDHHFLSARIHQHPNKRGSQPISSQALAESVRVEVLTFASI